MNLSFIQNILRDPKRRQTAMGATLFVLGIIGFVFVYFNYFRTTPEFFPLEEAPGAIGGKPITSSEASKEIINKLENDIKNLQGELKNSFYTELREYKPAAGETTQPGRVNPFTP